MRNPPVKPTDADIEAIDEGVFHGDLILLLDELRKRSGAECDRAKKKKILERKVKVRRKIGWNISADLLQKDIDNGEY